jgi:hypothetical protein
VRGKEKEKRQRGTETRYKIVLLEGDSLYWLSYLGYTREGANVV